MKRAASSAFIVLAALAAGFLCGRISTAHVPVLAGRSGPAAAETKASSTVGQLADRLAAECRAGVWRLDRGWKERLDALSPAQLLQWIGRVRFLALNPAQDELSRVVFSRWAAQEPEAAFENAGRMADPVLREAAMRCVWESWLLNDPTAAVAWLRGQPA